MTIVCVCKKKRSRLCFNRVGERKLSHLRIHIDLLQKVHRCKWD